MKATLKNIDGDVLTGKAVLLAPMHNDGQWAVPEPEKWTMYKDIRLIREDYIGNESLFMVWTGVVWALFRGFYRRR